MARAVVLAIVGALLLGVCPAHGGPMRGHYREQHQHDMDKARLEVGKAYEFHDTFLANQRACVIVEGDHKPVVNLNIKVFDAAGNLVAEDKAGGDFLAVMWYPARTQLYLISITSPDSDDYNALDIVVK